MSELVIFVLFLHLLVGIVLVGCTWVLFTNKGPKAAEIKLLIREIWISLKDLFSKVSKLYDAIEEFVKELLGQSSLPSELIEGAREEDQSVESESLKVNQIDNSFPTLINDKDGPKITKN